MTSGMESKSYSQLTIFVTVSLCVTLLKVLLIPSYHSTDFEVHRNWLAITKQLPISRWYTEATSIWTLDYPPLFAWFEWTLSQFASFFDAEMVHISSIPYASIETVYFQRATVIITDLVYFYAVYQWMKIINDSEDSVVGLDFEPSDKWFSATTITSILFLFNPGLLIVDHIHFQYNGFLSGILLLSLARMVQNRELESAFWFAVLLNLKHIYIYVAPAFFVYLLRNYCFDRHFNLDRSRLMKLGAIVASVFTVSFGPFIAHGQLTQVLSRLFPFKRGLSHAYWAPNFWALYNTADKALSIVLRKKTGASMTSGLVQEFSHTVLPSVAPVVTFALVAAAMVPTLHHLWQRCHFSQDSPKLFLRAVILCAFSSFIFGWHVHEKAILMVILPLTPLAMYTEDEANIFLMVSFTGCYSLFPLLHQVGETPIKLILFVMYFIYAFKALNVLFIGEDEDADEDAEVPCLINRHEKLYLLGFIGVQLYYSFGNQLLGLDEKMPFLPLLFTSLYCSIGIIYSFVKLYTFSLKCD